MISRSGEVLFCKIKNDTSIFIRLRMESGREHIYLVFRSKAGNSQVCDEYFTVLFVPVYCT